MATYLDYNTANPGAITQTTPALTNTGANKIPQTNGSGYLDSSFLPPGIGPDTQTVVASEAIAAGAFVNIWSNTGAFAVRNADNSAAGKEAHGFCLTAFASGATATVYFNGNNVSVTGQSPGRVFLGTVGGATATAPTGTGKSVQLLGMAPNATTVNYTFSPPIILA